MKHRKQLLTGIVSSIAMFILIIDSKTTLAGAQSGIMLCIYTIIPSLLPFLFLSTLITSSLFGIGGKIFAPIRKLCRTPQGSEHIFLLGFLGGYPVGAQGIYQAYQSGQLTKTEAKKMLSFCSNAGPAFIFGMVGCLFSSPTIPWILWAIQITSAILVAMFLPKGQVRQCTLTVEGNCISVSRAVNQCIKITALICGWVIIFRILFSICDRWILWMLPAKIKVIICGLLEITNGCRELMAIKSEGLKLILSSCFLSFGGLCVIMQTSAITKELGISSYIKGKVMQLNISFILSTIVQWMIYPPESKIKISYPLILASVTLIVMQILIIYRKNNSSNIAAAGV